MSDLQFAVCVLLGAIFISTIYQTFAFQTLSIEKNKRKKLTAIGVIVSLILAVSLVYSGFRDWSALSLSVIEPSESFSDSHRQKIKSEHLHTDLWIRQYVHKISEFSKTLKTLSENMQSLADTEVHSESEREILAGKALHFRDKATSFHQKVLHAEKPQEAANIHQEFLRATENLRLAAFALYAGLSSEDSEFRNLQKEQLRIQLQEANQKCQNVLVSLQKLAPDFYSQTK